MGISVYYNLNHHYFKCYYSPNYADTFKSDNEIDKLNRMFIQYIDSSPTALHKFIFKKLRKPLKYRLADKLIKIGKKLQTPNNSTNKTKNRYKWRSSRY